MGACIEQLEAAVGLLERTADDASDAAELMQQLVPIERRIGAVRTRLARRAVTQGATERSRDKDAASWLASQTGTSKVAAKKALDTQERLDELPALRDAFEKGELSPDQAEAVARAAEHAPDEQAHLLETAKHEPLGELRKECDRVIAASDPDFAHRHERVWRNRSVGTYKRADGSKTLTATGTPTDIATLESRLRRVLPTIQKLQKEQDDTEAGIEAAMFDALMHLTSPDAANENDDEKKAPPAASTSCSCGGRPRVVYRSTRDLLFHLSYSAAIRGRVLPGELCELDGEGPVPLSEALDFSTDPFVKAVLRDGTSVHKVLHFGRKVPAELRTALEAQGRRCAVPGCPNHAWLEVDHALVDHAAGGPLALWNAQFLCTYHHRLKSAGKLGDLPPPPAARPPDSADRGMAAPRAPT